MSDLALVTGATGFVGSALCRALLNSGWRVRALHRSSSKLDFLNSLPLETFEGDILDRERMFSACADVRWVFHAASQSAYWRDPAAVNQSAVVGTSNLADAALATGVERLVFTSSIAAMGVPEPGTLLTEEHSFNLPEKQFPYGAAKRQAELVLQERVRQGLDAVIVNPTIILGPGDINMISGSMVVEAARGWGFFYLDGGNNYVHINDVVKGHLAAAEEGVPGARYILGGENLSHQAVFSILTEIAGRRSPWLKIPRWIVPPAAWLVDRIPRSFGLPFDGGQLRMSLHHMYCDADTSRKTLHLGEPLPFRQAAQDAYDWYRQQGLLS